jgi:HEAT repeat protein
VETMRDEDVPFPFSVEELNGRLRNGSAEVRVEAALQLADLAAMLIGDISSVKPLNDLIDDPDLPNPAAPIMAIGELACMRIGDVSSLPYLEKAVLEGDSRVRISSIQALSSLASELDIKQESTLAILNYALSDRDPRVLEAAADALGEMALCHLADHSSVWLLNPLLTHADEDVRLRVVETLTRLAGMSVGDGSSIAGLNALLNEHKDDLREAAAEALEQLALMRIGHHSSIDLLNELMLDQNEGVRLSAVSAVIELAKLRIGNASSLGPLKKLLDDANYGIRDLTRICLFELACYLNVGDREVIGRLDLTLSEEESSRRWVAAMTLREMARIGIGSRSSILPLERLLNDKGQEVAEAAAGAINALALHLKIGEVSSVRALNSRLEKFEFGCYKSAVAIGSLAWIGIGEKDSIEPLNRMLSFTNQECVETAVIALGNLAKIRIGDDSSLEPLHAILRTHPNDHCGFSAENALRDLAFLGIE